MTPFRSWLKDFMATERRGAKRGSFGALVAFYPDGSTPLAHCVQNASAAGFYLLTDQRWYPGTVLTMTLQKKNVPKGEKGRCIEVLARVIRADENGVAFAFVLPHGHESDRDSLPLSRLADEKGLGNFLRGLKEDEANVSIEFALLAALVPLLVAGILEFKILEFKILEFKLESWSAIWFVTALAAAAAIGAWRNSSAHVLLLTYGPWKWVYYVGKSFGPRINSAQMAYPPSESWKKSVVVPSILAQPCSGRVQ
jgi:hypothetical protein